MRDVTFTIYRNAQDTSGKPITQSWEKWLELFSRHEIRGNPEDSSDKAALDRAKNGPAIVLGEIPIGEPRKGANVKSVHALALDLENETEERLEQAFESLAEFEFVVWTTHKHGSEIADGFPRLRVLLPFNQSIEPSKHADAWARLDRLIDGLNDPATKDIGRLHFLPSTFDITKARFHHHPGKWLQFEDLAVPEPNYKTVDPNAITKLRNQLRRFDRNDPLKEPLSKLFSGESFAEQGNRHRGVLALTMWIAERNSNLDKDTLSTLFEPSLMSMRSIAADAPTVDEVVTAYDGAVKKLSELEQQNAEEKARQAREEQLKLGGAQTNIGPYTDADLERIAAVNNWTVAELKTRWVIQKGSTIWVLGENGEYCGPYSKDEWGTATARILSRAPVSLTEVTRSGVKWRSMIDVFRECGSVAKGIVADLAARRCWYDPVTEVMKEAVSPVRNIEPKFDPEIDAWLKVLGGPYYDKLVDWMSCASDLTKMLCAIYFDGPTMSGKTLLAVGMAKIWSEGPPAELLQVLSSFNDEISRCPLILGDEEIPKLLHTTVTATLRSMLSTTSRTYKRKYLSTSEIRGCVRLILTANNEFLLDTKEVTSQQDLEAIAQRFLYIKVSKEAAETLGEMEREKKEEWARNGIAAHALWLAKNHAIKTPGKRFWVEGDVGYMHSQLLTGSKWNSIVCEWLVRYLMNPKPFDTKATGLIRIEEGQLLVNDQAIIDGWSLYLNTKQEPETSKIGTSLRAISSGADRKQLRFGGRQVRYRPINIVHLLSWADRYNIGSKETLLAALGTAVEGNNNNE